MDKFLKNYLREQNQEKYRTESDKLESYFIEKGIEFSKARKGTTVQFSVICEDSMIYLDETEKEVIKYCEENLISYNLEKTESEDGSPIHHYSFFEPVGDCFTLDGEVDSESNYFHFLDAPIRLEECLDKFEKVEKKSWKDFFFRDNSKLRARRKLEKELLDKFGIDKKIKLK